MFFGEFFSGKKNEEDEILNELDEVKKKLHSLSDEMGESQTLLNELHTAIGGKENQEKMFQDTPQEPESQRNKAAIELETFLQSKEGKKALEILKRTGKTIFIAKVLRGRPERGWTGWSHNYYLGPNGLYREDIYEQNYGGDRSYTTPTRMFEEINDKGNAVTSKIYSSETDFMECLKNELNDALGDAEHEESSKERNTSGHRQTKDDTKYPEEFEEFQKRKKIYEGIIKTSQAKSERDQARKLYKLMTGHEYEGPEYQEK